MDSTKSDSDYKYAKTQLLYMDRSFFFHAQKMPNNIRCLL